MKKFKPTIGVGSTCGPSLKDLKLELAETKRAKKIIRNLDEAGYLSYEISDQVYGNICRRIKRIKDNIKRTKVTLKQQGKK